MNLGHAVKWRLLRSNRRRGGPSSAKESSWMKKWSFEVPEYSFSFFRHSLLDLKRYEKAITLLHYIHYITLHYLTLHYLKLFPLTWHCKYLCIHAYSHGILSSSGALWQCIWGQFYQHCFMLPHLFADYVKEDLSLKELDCLPVSAKWYRLGLQLGVREDHLDTIEKNYPRDNDMCKIKMFGKWLRGDTSATYEKLVRALATIGMRNLAESVCNAKGTCRYKIL